MNRTPLRRRPARRGAQLLARLWLAAAGIWLLAAPQAARAAVIPHGEAFAIDPAGAPQAAPRVGVSASGAAVVVWQTSDPDGPGLDVVAQLSLPDGATRQFVVHEERAGYQLSPVVAMAASGSFAVAWQRNVASDEADVFIRFFAQDGTPLGLEQEVNPVPGGHDRAPDLAMAPDGRAILVWQSEVRWGKGLGSTAWRLFAASFMPGGAREGDWRVGDAFDGDQTGPRVAMASHDRYAIAWEHLPPQLKTNPPAANAARVYLARTTPAGTVEERVAPGEAGAHGEPALAMDHEGNLAVAWRAPGATTDSIFARAYPAAGSLGAVLQVSPPAAEARSHAAIAAGERGSFVVLWQHGGASGAPAAVSARSYGADGQPDGDPFALPQADGRRAFFPQVALRPDGSGLAVWHSLPAAGIVPLVYARRLGPPFQRPPATPIPRTPSQTYRVLLPLVIDGAA